MDYLTFCSLTQVLVILPGWRGSNEAAALRAWTNAQFFAFERLLARKQFFAFERLLARKCAIWWCPDVGVQYNTKLVSDLGRCAESYVKRGPSKAWASHKENWRFHAWPFERRKPPHLFYLFDGLWGWWSSGFTACVTRMSAGKLHSQFYKLERF